MKRTIALLLALAMTICFCACGNKTSTPDESKNSSDSVKVDEGLLTVKITIPASFLDTDDTPESIQKEATEKGFKSCTINDDGSVTYEMTKSKRNDLLKEIKEELDANLEEVVNDEDCSIEKVDYNKNLTEFTAYTNSNYTAYDNLNALVFYMHGAIYQLYNGVKQDDIDIKVKFVDSETKEVVYENTYKKFAADMKNSVPDEE